MNKTIETPELIKLILEALPEPDDVRPIPTGSPIYVEQLGEDDHAVIWIFTFKEGDGKLAPENHFYLQFSIQDLQLFRRLPVLIMGYHPDLEVFAIFDRTRLFEIIREAGDRILSVEPTMLTACHAIGRNIDGDDPILGKIAYFPAEQLKRLFEEWDNQYPAVRRGGITNEQPVKKEEWDRIVSLIEAPGLIQRLAVTEIKGTLAERILYYRGNLPYLIQLLQLHNQNLPLKENLPGEDPWAVLAQTIDFDMLETMVASNEDKESEMISENSRATSGGLGNLANADIPVEEKSSKDDDPERTDLEKRRKYRQERLTFLETAIRDQRLPMGLVLPDGTVIHRDKTLYDLVIDLMLHFPAEQIQAQYEKDLAEQTSSMRRNGIAQVILHHDDILKREDPQIRPHEHPLATDQKSPYSCWHLRPRIRAYNITPIILKIAEAFGIFIDPVFEGDNVSFNSTNSLNKKKKSKQGRSPESKKTDTSSGRKKEKPLLAVQYEDGTRVDYQSNKQIYQDVLQRAGSPESINEAFIKANRASPVIFSEKKEAKCWKPFGKGYDGWLFNSAIETALLVKRIQDIQEVVGLKVKIILK